MKIYLVGGAVRDKLLGLPVKERDWVVVGATVNDMLKAGFKQVGKEFPVFLHPKTGEEYALARMERKVKPGYKGFTFDTSPEVTLEDDLIRRDLTINAMAETPEGQLIDPYHGKQDLENKILRHVSSAFAEDPVRILRLGRFLARFAHLGFHVAKETIQLMRDMVAAGEVDALVAERVWKELERALSEKHPEKFFEVLAECGALPKLFPHLKIDGPGMQALKAASQLSTHTTLRLATLFYALPEEDTDKSAAKKLVSTLCHRYRIPNAYRELATLTIEHYAKALTANTLSAEELLQLFSALDIFRREERFHDFLLTCLAIAHSQGLAFDPTWLSACATATKSVDIQALIAQGLDGSALAVKLKEKRREKIEQWLASI